MRTKAETDDEDEDENKIDEKTEEHLAAAMLKLDQQTIQKTNKARRTRVAAIASYFLLLPKSYLAS